MADQTELTWGVQQRFEFIEWRAYWAGKVSRKDLEDEFQISAPQASLDLRNYQENAPGNIEYSPSDKIHLPTADFNPLFLALSPERFLLQLQALITGAIRNSDTWFDAIPSADVIPQIVRWPQAYTLRAIIRAIESKSTLSINYQSLKHTGMRTICPHALGYDGNRWHVRAWSVEREDFRDYVLGRILSIGAAEPYPSDSADDLEWHTPITLRLVAHPDLDERQRATIEHDYHFKNGELAITMRIALAFYFVRRHNLDLRDSNIAPERLQLFLQNYEEYTRTSEAAKRISKARAAARKSH